jgi:SAM-dependent methyltransferase
MKFIHIPECLYYYRFLRESQNTHQVKNAKIQEVVQERYEKHLLSMCLVWCANDGLLALDLGSSHNKPGEQWHGVDIEKGPGVDTVADLSEKWPFPDNSVGVIRAVDFVEHMPAGKEIHFFNEAWRVLTHGGMLLIEVPSTDGRGAFQDPTHTCHSEDTEVLTTEGFKLFRDLDGTEKVWTMNPETKEAEISEIEKVHEHDFDGELIAFTSRNVDCLVTPNHRMYVGSSDDTTSMNFVEASDVANRKSCSRIPHGVIFKGATPEYFEIPDSKLKLLSNPNKDFSQDTLRLPMKEFIRFLGWYISEGYTTIKTDSESSVGNYYRIGICQSKKANLVKYETIGDIIRALGFEPWRDESGWYLSCKPLALWLAELGHSHQKYIPRVILGLDPSLLQELIEGLSLGNGHLQSTGFTYGTISPQLASDVFELGIKLGYRVTWSKENRIGKQAFVNPGYRSKYDMNLIYFSRSKHRYIKKTDRIPYSGKVYCVTAKKNHIICTRRNGKMIWSGNSFMNENSFWYYTQDSHKRFLNGKFKGSFGAKKVFTYAPGGPGGFCDKHKILYVRAHLVAHKDTNAFPIPMPHPSL